MIIINLSLVIIFCCIGYVVLFSRIKIEWFAKLIMCIMMISSACAGFSINTEYNLLSNVSWNLFFSGVAFFACLFTYKANKRGYY